MMKNKRIFWSLFYSLILCTMFFIGFAHATDYYVKSGGNNGNTGLNDGQAWEFATGITVAIKPAGS